MTKKLAFEWKRKIKIWRKERAIYKTLCLVSRQTAFAIVKDCDGEDEFFVLNTPKLDSRTLAMLQTCYLRGWLEPAPHSLPAGDFNEFKKHPNPKSFHKVIYRVTDAGWNIIYRNHLWIRLTCILTFITLILLLVKY